MWVRFSGRLERLFCLTFSKASDAQPATVSSPTLAKSGSMGSSAARRAGTALLSVLALVACLVVGNTALAQAPPDPATLVPVFVDPTAVLTVVQTKLTALFLPFIMFSIGVMLLILIWRTGKRYAGGHS